ncbi:facilitated trehalose transporter Tret1-2 homolog [Anabrus simplex]|uniref:facilitated trehalose transporter Tret1-2 homolog n=1 Tax=Anabrus simplex TaxID=316456 RepID=UPI0034DD4D5E
MESKGGSRVPQYLATIILDLLHLSYGLAIGWPATALPQLMSEDTPLSTGPISEEDASWLAAIFYFVAAASMPLYSFLCEKLGRKKCGYLVGIPYVISGILLAAADSLPMLQAAKVFLGLSAGGIFVLCPVYVSEIAEDEIRGSLGVFLTLLRSIGILIANIIGTFFSLRTVACISLVPPVLYLLCLPWLPETPIYLLRRGKTDKATRSLQWFRGKGTVVDQEIQDMTSGLRNMKSDGAAAASFKDLFASKGTIKAVSIGVMLCFNQQMSGFFGVISYTVEIFQEAGSSLAPNISSIIVSVMLVGATIAATVLCDKVGRKILLFTSNALMIVSLAILGIYFHVKEAGGSLSGLGWIPLTCLSLYVISYSIGLGPLPIVLMTEIFSPRLRNMAITSNGVLVWFSIFLVTKFYPNLCEALGKHGAFYLFSVCCVIGAVYMQFVLPETKNRPQEAILEDLQGTSRSIVPSETDKEQSAFLPPTDVKVVKSGEKSERVT